MAILIAQLCDIHFRAPSDVIAARAVTVGAAIAAEVTSDTSTVVIANCGDAAYSGAIAQFAAATTFFTAIEEVIRSRHSSVGIKRIAIPGNHDCDFSDDQAARDAVIQTINDTTIPARSIQEIAVGPLKHYFAHVAAYAPDTSISSSRPFYHSVDIDDKDKICRLHLVNSAWMSSKHERPGSLLFPLATITPPSVSPHLSVALLHHPTNWFSQPHAMRPLRDRLAALASVILVNHEHYSEASAVVPLFDYDGEAKRTIYVAGGVLQEDGTPDLCCFNLVRLDMHANSLSISRYEFAAQPNPHFSKTKNAEIELVGVAIRAGAAGYALREDAISYLEDPGAPISHPSRDPRIPVKLSEIFIYPDLWELDTDHEGADQKQIRSSRVVEEVLKSEKVLLTGGEKSGRTCLIKRLFMEAFNAGKIPLRINGKDIPKSPAKIREFIRHAVSQHYVNLSPDAYEQLERDKTIILIDDVHLMRVSVKAREELLEELERRTGQIVVCGDDLVKLDELRGQNAKESHLWTYRHLVIIGFGDFVREQLVRRWLLLSSDVMLDEDFLDREVERLCDVLNVVIRKQLLPSYPLFLIVVLQQADASMSKASVQGGSFGHLFEGVITAVLSKSAFTRISISDKYHYLAALAKHMFDAKSMELPVGGAQKWHRQYWDGIEVDIDYGRLSEDLIALGVLSEVDGAIKFKYAYYFCFFVAFYLDKTVHEVATRNTIADLCRHLHHRVSADIVLFLAHLTGDPIVLDEMVKTCDGLFAGVHPATFDTDVEPLNRLMKAMETLAIPDCPAKNREDVKLRTDERVAERMVVAKTDVVEPPEADNEIIKHIFEVQSSYKTIQILGQALRNVAGSASKERKEEVIGKIIGLSRRILGSYFDMFVEERLPEVIREIAEAHKDQQPELTATELHKEVNRHLCGMSEFVCFALIRHTTSSVGAENLLPTIKRVLSTDKVTAEKLFSISFDLDRPGRFPKDDAIKLYADLRKNTFAASLVRMLVAFHMYMYVVPIQDRQSVCERLSITLTPRVLDMGRKRLTS